MITLNVQNPHDKFFKETFSNSEVVKDFIQHYFPPVLLNLVDLNSIQPQKDSFINKDLQEHFSDMLFRLNINEQQGYLYLLFEHKSFVSQNISIQLLKYMIEIWQAKKTKEQQSHVPIIIPLVIFHGKDKWNTPRSLGELIDGYMSLPKKVKKYVPDYEYILYDISSYEDEEIKGVAQLKILLTIFRDIFTEEQDILRNSIQRSTEYLLELEDQTTAIQYFETFFRYIFHTAGELTDQDFRDIIEHVEKTYPEGSELVMTLAERFQEKGRQQGIHQGETKALAKTAIKLIAKYIAPVPEKMAEQIKKQDISTLETIIENVYEHQNLKEIERYLT
ncbi:Rpn family recombination-promoting nuclease/putative transposase [Gracilibacillus sp. YIM 98692]|uniref:Rpn family recombination-promoting nuclease/putative transposase n=1 Tax=Gracilibacillus sp. YIM 98692 TaxID=2663532 RepID=UPI001F09B84D|nr:Rpn family recombination-promoting nuclease/putative transposase [Gracilibacillus sp. YIM 98692]